jgi:hypothetical protein
MLFAEAQTEINRLNGQLQESQARAEQASSNAGRLSEKCLHLERVRRELEEERELTEELRRRGIALAVECEETLEDLASLSSELRQARKEAQDLGEQLAGAVSERDKHQKAREEQALLLEGQMAELETLRWLVLKKDEAYQALRKDMNSLLDRPHRP